MLCCIFQQTDYGDEVARKGKHMDDMISKELREEKKRRQREHRVLLLGCGEAGKSTFIKQMRIIHSGGFTTAERLEIKDAIAANIVSAIQTLVQNAVGFDNDLEEAAKVIEALPPRLSPLELLAHAENIERLWASEALQAAYEKRNRFQLVECAKYFLTRTSTVLKENYLPSDQDIVQTRVQTTGIIEHDFILKPESSSPKKLILIDVGGQRSERRKWIHCFEDVMLILFLTAISEYDQVLAEDEATNRMRESLMLFRTILDYNWFKETNMIVFLNKMDVLEEKVAKSPVNAHFPDFDGPEGDAKAVIDYFGDRFQEQNPNPEDRQVYVHPTCATDTENIKIVDTIVRDTIMSKILGSVGMD